MFRFMTISVLLLILGFVLLVLGAERLLEGSVSLAARYNISNVVVGLIIVSLCTSAPEFFSSLKATYISPDIAISNILGSNIFNILGILGLVSILTPVSTRPFNYRVELLLLFLSGGLFAFFLNYNLLSLSPSTKIYSITQLEACILLFVLLASLGFSILKNKKAGSSKPKLPALAAELAYIFLGVLLLSLGSHFAITNSLVIAKHFGLSPNFIGLTLIGVATGLPELITSLIASYKKQTDIAIGNIVGSNLFNLLGVIGGVSIIHPIKVYSRLEHNTDLLFASLCVLILFLSMAFRPRISKFTATMYLCLYISFITWKLL